MDVTKNIQSLLDRELPPDYRRDATDRVAASPQTTVQGSESVVIIRVYNEWLALPTTIFERIADVGPVHSLPNRREGALLGLTNVQGELLVCISLAALLGITGAEPRNDTPHGHERLVIVTSPEGSVAFPVHAVHGVHHYRTNELREIPATLARAQVRYTTGLFLVDDKSVARLDDALVLHAVSRAFG